MRFRKLLIVGMALMAFGLTACGNDIIIDVVTNDTNISSSQGAGSQNAADQPAESGKPAENTGSQAPAAQNPSGEGRETAAGTKVIAAKDLKIGVLYISSSEETSGYTYAHELGIQGMVSNLGLSADQVVRKDSVNDSDPAAIRTALQECVDAGCNVIFTTSWGYMELTQEFAGKYPDIYFAHGTGYLSNGRNFTNYFGRIYQARYLSGIVAGLKTQSGKIGYVSAMGRDNSECTGGIDAFAMGVESVNPEAAVYVAVTNSWFDPVAEEGAARALIGEGCDVLAQHCDTTAPQVVSEENGTWAIGYNSDMSKETPAATLTSVIWNWSAYYTSYVNSIVDGSYDGSDYYGGIDENLVELTSLAAFCGEGTDDKVQAVRQRLLAGEFGVFDGVLETNEGTTVGAAGATLDDATITGGINWYYRNVRLLDWN